MRLAATCARGVALRRVPDLLGIGSPAPQNPGPGETERAAAARAYAAGDQAASPHSGRWIARIAVRSVDRIVIVPVEEIVRLEAEDNYVRIWADRPYLQKESLTRLVARLDPASFLRIHRSHAVNVERVRELRPLQHGEYRILLANGTELVSGRSYRQHIQEAFGLGHAYEQA